MADSTLSSGDSASHVIRCAECHELVPADRVRHREEHVKVAPPPRGRWRTGGPPIFQPTPQGPHPGPGLPAGARAAPPRNAYTIERIPVCENCLRRQRMGLYAICGIAASCVLVAVALYSREPAPPNSQQVALLTPPVAPNATPTPPATPKPQAPSTAFPVTPPAQDETADAQPIWQPIWEAAKNFLPSPSPSATADIPNTAPASEDIPPVIASASPSTPAATAEPTPPAAADGSVAALPTDVVTPDSSNPAVWATDHRAARKVAKATPSRRAVPATNAVAIRNTGFAALGQGRYGEAMSLLQQATMMGDAYAPMYIGQLYERGVGVPRDVGQASYWYGIAINRGNGTALVAFNRMRMNPY